MTLQEFAKSTPDFWKWIAEGRKFKLWDHEEPIISHVSGVSIFNTSVTFQSEIDDYWYYYAEPIQTIKKPVSFAEAVKWFEDPENGWEYCYQPGCTPYYNNPIRAFRVSMDEIRKICEGRKFFPYWFPCVEVEEEEEI